MGTPISGIPVDYLDTPGVGDTDVTPMKVLTMIEQELRFSWYRMSFLLLGRTVHFFSLEFVLIYFHLSIGYRLSSNMLQSGAYDR